MEFRCKNCGALYKSEESPEGLECTCECTEFILEKPVEFEKEEN